MPVLGVGGCFLSIHSVTAMRLLYTAMGLQLITAVLVILSIVRT